MLHILTACISSLSKELSKMSENQLYQLLRERLLEEALNWLF